MMNKGWLSTVGVVLFFSAFAYEMRAMPEGCTNPDVRLTFANPIDLEYRMRETGCDWREGADPEIVLFKDRYWLFASKLGGYYVSDDLARWTLVKTDDLPLEEYAPTALVWNGELVFSTRGGGVWHAVDPAAGKWEYRGKHLAFVEESADSKLFLDDDGRLYCYAGAGADASPVYGFELDPATCFGKTPYKPLFVVDRQRHGSDVGGDENELTNRASFIEGANMLKAKGRYYLQYAGPGTQFTSYADTALVGTSPLGPFVRQKLNPFSYKPDGFVRGAGHGSTFFDRYGNCWHVTTCVHKDVDRRIVLLPVFFDADGEMWCDTSLADGPIAIPQHKAKGPEDFRTDWMPLTLGKRTQVTAKAEESSFLTDGDARTVWSAKGCSAGNWAKVDLGCEAEIRAVQVCFSDGGAAEAWRRPDAVRRYRIEVSDDDKTWRTVADETGGCRCGDCRYHPLKTAVRARWLRVLCLGFQPRTEFALREIRAFGRMDKPRPAIPEGLSVVRDAADRRHATVSWQSVEGALGYVLRYGPTPAKRHLTRQVVGKVSVELRSLDTESDYSWALMAYDEGGCSESSVLGGGNE